MKLNPEVYLCAAEMLETSYQPWLDELQLERGPALRWCCPAIAQACKEIYLTHLEQKLATFRHQEVFERIFKPTIEELRESSLSLSVWWGPAGLQARLTALNLAAAIVSPNP